VKFVVVADIEFDFAEAVAGIGELAHGKLGKFVVHGFVPKSVIPRSR